MPAAKCENCGHLFHWRNQRGVRLKDFKCPECGASGIKRAVWEKITSIRMASIGNIFHLTSQSTLTGHSPAGYLGARFLRGINNAIR